MAEKNSVVLGIHDSVVVINSTNQEESVKEEKDG